MMKRKYGFWFLVIAVAAAFIGGAFLGKKALSFVGVNLPATSPKPNGIVERK